MDDAVQSRNTCSPEMCITTGKSYIFNHMNVKALTSNKNDDADNDMDSKS